MSKGTFLAAGVIALVAVQMTKPTTAEPGSPAPAEWAVPTSGACTSGFGARWGSQHYGLDIGAPIGTPIVAASSGEVISAGPASGYGLWVRVDHGEVITVYGHVDSYQVHVGQHVETGQQIAALGNRGNSTGPHLHFQVEPAGQPVDPVGFYSQQGVQLC